MSNTATETQADATNQKTVEQLPMKLNQVLDLLDKLLRPEREKWEFVESGLFTTDLHEGILPGVSRIMRDGINAFEEVYRKINEAHKLDRKLNPPPPVKLADLPWVQNKETVTMPEEQEEG